MAQVREIRLVDDLDGTPADETVQFGLDGQLLEADLTTANASKLREALAPFVSVARKSVQRPAKRSAAGTSSRRSSAERDENAKVREWGERNGFAGAAGRRGRMPADLLEAYRRAHAVA